MDKRSHEFEGEQREVYGIVWKEEKERRNVIIIIMISNNCRKPKRE